jgi:hypothetical protein
MNKLRFLDDGKTIKVQEWKYFFWRTVLKTENPYEALDVATDNGKFYNPATGYWE